MKRIVSLFFLAVFLFQVGGYYIVFWGMEHRAKQGLLHRLDSENYSSKELVVLTIPLSLPYPLPDDNAFERVNGDFEYRGQAYKLVKQKMENDTLFVVCIKDEETTKISGIFSELTKFTHSLPVSSKKAVTFLSKIYKDFKSTEFKMLYKSRVLYETTYYAENSTLLTSPTLLVDSPPPELF